MKVRVTGFKVFIGQVNGSKINSGKMYTECRLDESRNDGENQISKGVFTEEWRVDPDIIKRLKHLPLPFDADFDIERVGNGKESRELVIDVRPLEVVKPVKAA